MINIPAQTISGTYIVVAGDTLNSIAHAFNIPAKALKQANPNITDWTQIYVGQVINIPK
jgi:LysM repeat protein